MSEKANVIEDLHSLQMLIHHLKEYVGDMSLKPTADELSALYSFIEDLDYCLDIILDSRHWD